MAKTHKKQRASRQSQYATGSGDVVPMEPLRKKQKANRNNRQAIQGVVHGQEDRVTRSAPLICRTEAQKRYKQVIEASTICIGVGPAGTGKSFVALKIACRLFDEGEIKYIIVTRPAVAVEEDLGALPGTLEEKTAPWFAPMLEILNEHFGAGHVQGMIHSKRIQFVPLSHLRGRTFNNSFILLDEAQNTSPNQMKALLTRLGSFSKIVVDGDIDQEDIKEMSGLEDLLRRLKRAPSIGLATFDIGDVVRHPLIKEILHAYASDGPSRLQRILEEQGLLTNNP